MKRRKITEEKTIADDISHHSYFHACAMSYRWPEKDLRQLYSRLPFRAGPHHW